MTATKGTRLENSGWEPDEAARSFAVMCGLDPDAVWAEFQDYWISKPGRDATKLDWKRTWQNRCRAIQGYKSHPAKKEAAAPVSDIPQNCHRKWVNNKSYSIMDARALLRQKDNPWPLTDEEQQVVDAYFGGTS